MDQFPFRFGALVFIACYLVLMLVLGWIARRQRKSESLSDFYLAGKNLGWFVLLLTLYATQYSGNTLIGYPGEAFRLGFPWIMSIGFMMSIIVVYLVFAPRLQKLARRHHFITPGDWLDFRYQSPTLTLIANMLLVVAIANFLLAQLMAMGHIVSGLSGGMLPYWLGVVLLAAVIIVYETLGGMRAVAWTDCIQGLMLLIGFAGLLIAVFPSTNHLKEVTEWIVKHQPEKAQVPPWSVLRTWVSTIVLVGVSGAIYPQAIQRIYAARNTQTLKVSLSIMVFMPLVSTLVVFLVGIAGIPHFQGLGEISADRVMPLMLREWAAQTPVMYVLAILVITGIVAAIMSTADSVLLSLSSILAKDFLGKTWLKHKPETDITRAGKLLSWVIMVILVFIALQPRITLWGLTELKMELLAQAAPAMILGVFWRRLDQRALLPGTVAGTVLAVALAAAGSGKVWGLHAGLLGLLLNLGICILSQAWLNRQEIVP